MKLGFAMLADAAQLSDGKVSIIGGDYDTIYAASYPARHPVLTLVVRLDFEPSEAAHEHRVHLSMTGPLGSHVITTEPRPFTPTLPAGAARRTRDVLKAYIVVTVNGLIFEQQGKYTIKTVVDGTTVSELPLYLEKPQAPSGGNATQM